MAIGGGYFDDRGMVFWRQEGSILGRWSWSGPLGSSYDGYLQQEARYAIGRWGLVSQLGSSYDGYLQQEARFES